MSAFMREFNMLAGMLHEEHDAAVTAVESEANACLELALELLDLVAIKSLDAEKELSQLLEDYDGLSKELTSVRSMMVSARKCKPKQDDDCDDDDDDDEYEDDEDDDEDDDLEEDDYDDIEMEKICQYVSKNWLGTESVLTYEGLKEVVTNAGKKVWEVIKAIFEALTKFFMSKETEFKNAVSGMKALVDSGKLQKMSNLAIKEGTNTTKIAPLMSSSSDSDTLLATTALTTIFNSVGDINVAFMSDCKMAVAGEKFDNVTTTINALFNKKFGKYDAMVTSSSWGLVLVDSEYKLVVEGLKADKTFMINTKQLHEVVKAMMKMEDEVTNLFKTVADGKEVTKMISNGSVKNRDGLVALTKQVVNNTKVCIDTCLYLYKAPLYAVKMANISEDKE